MKNGKKIGVLLPIIAGVYFLWILIVASHEGGFLLEDTDFILSLWEWAIIGIALYLLFILILLFFFFPKTRGRLSNREFKLVEGRKNKVICSNCKTQFSVNDTGERPLNVACPHCSKEGVLAGKKVTAIPKTISCKTCGNTFEILDDGTEPLSFECPECHQQDTIP